MMVPPATQLATGRATLVEEVQKGRDSFQREATKAFVGQDPRFDQKVLCLKDMWKSGRWWFGGSLMAEAGKVRVGGVVDTRIR